MRHQESARFIQNNSPTEDAACMMHNCPWKSWRSRCPEDLGKKYRVFRGHQPSKTRHF